MNLARELSLAEIREIASGSGIETEAFIHGAMCISYSGRCLLSNIMNERDANRGLCSHPCRWKYSVVEEMRPNDLHPLMEDERGSYFFNSKDLCMIGHIPELVSSGITSFKIEGRMKGIHYLATVVRAYRKAIDAFTADPGNYRLVPEWQDELDQVFHRAYCTGFYFHHPNDPESDRLNQDNTHQGKIHSFIGKIEDCLGQNRYLVAIRNKLTPQDQVQVLTPKGPVHTSPVIALTDAESTPIENAKPNTRAVITLDREFHPNDIIRKM